MDSHCQKPEHPQPKDPDEYGYATVGFRPTDHLRSAASCYDNCASCISLASLPNSLLFLISHFLRLLSVTMQGTSSSLQLVQGAPCSTTLHLTFLALQHWQAFDALLFTGRPLALVPRPALEALRLELAFGELWSSEAEGEFGSCSSGAVVGSGVILAVVCWLVFIADMLLEMVI